MHPALLIPEIVSMILFQMKYTGGLHSCLYVNRLFFAETARLIWEDGSYLSLQRLVSIARRDPVRGQFYSNFIKHLFIEHENDDQLEDKTYAGAQLDLYSNPILRALTFPRLDLLSLNHLETSSLELINTSDILLPFLASNTITRLFLGNDHVPSSSMLYTIRLHCPNLRYLALGQNLFLEADPDSELEQKMNRAYTRNLSEAVMIQFLQSAHNLIHFEASKTSIGYTWSKDLFATLAKLPSLKTLRCPVIESPDWITDLHNIAGAFSHLDELEIDIDYSTLQNLAPFLTNLQTFMIDMVQTRATLPIPTIPNQSPISIVANMTQLKVLEIRFPFKEPIQIWAQDLLSLSQNCRGLQDLKIYSGGGTYYPSDFISCEDMDDLIMDQIARNLPNLQIISLCTGPLHLTNACFISFFSSCKQLWKFQMTCRVDAEALLLSLRSGKYESHKCLREVIFIVGSQRMPKCSDPDGLAKGLNELMPCLEKFSLFGDNNADDHGLNRAYVSLLQPLCKGF